MSNLFAGNQCIAGLYDHFCLQPFLCRQNDICVSREGGWVHIHVYNELQLVDGFFPTAGFCQYAQLVSGTVDPDFWLIRLARKDRIQHTARMAGIPDAKALEFLSAETFFKLFFRKTLLCDRNRIVRDLQHAAGAEPLHRNARFLHVAHQHIHGVSSHCCLNGVWSLIRSHTQAKSARGVVCVKADRFFYFCRVQLTDLTSFFQREFVCTFQQQLCAGLICFSIDLIRAKQSNVQIILIWIGKSFCGRCLLIPDGEDIDAVCICLILSQTQFARTDHFLCIGIDQIRKVGPFQNKVVVIQFIGQNVTDPGQHQCHIGTRADRKPDSCFGCIRCKTRIDHHSLHAFCAKLIDHTSAAGRTGEGRVRSPKHECLNRIMFFIIEFQTVGIGY